MNSCSIGYEEKRCPISKTMCPGVCIYSDILENIDLGIIVLDILKETVVFQNSAALEILNAATEPKDYAAIRDLLVTSPLPSANSGQTKTLCYGSRLLGHTVYNIMNRYSWIFLRDITEKARLESIAETVNTMDNIGYIFMGIRHEIENPLTPVLVMTAYGTPEIERRLKAVGVSPYLEKPLDLNVLAERIFGDMVSNPRGVIQGISLASFLQMLEFERKSCTLKIRSKKGEGYLYFLEGELMDATFNNMGPDKAAYEIVVWDEVEMEIKTGCNRKKKTIKESLRFILMEAFRM